ncbi:MAG TPA: redox-regulated ATPase YchF [Clostridiales bacterium]|nr:redox-regulated ATPase YchF [Clostridiales bacterium]
MKLGVVGLPNVGKSTLFNAITRAGAQAANYPFCTISPNVGVVEVPDERLDTLSNMFSPKKTTPAVIEFVDIAGLVRGASRGEGLGNKFLSHIREVDAIVHVVRSFEDENIVHVDGSINPLRDMETINLELVFADLETVERRIDKTKKMAKGGDKALLAQVELFERIKAHLESGKPVRSCEFTEAEQEIVKQQFFLTSKPVIYVANIADNDISKENPYVKQVEQAAKEEGAAVIALCAKIEEEISELDSEEKTEFLEALGLAECGLNRLIRACYSLLGLISFFTVGSDECRAWTIIKGTKAPQAAGKIHTDFERGFIRAEVVPYDVLINEGSLTACKEKGLITSEGKDYIVKDGDIVHFRFNV